MVEPLAGPEHLPLPRIRPGEERAEQVVGQLMAAPMRFIAPDDRRAGKGQIADGVQHLVAHELVRAAEAIRVQHPPAIDDDRILQAATPPKAAGAKTLDLGEMAEGPAIAQLLGKGISRQAERAPRRAEDRKSVVSGT